LQRNSEKIVYEINFVFLSHTLDEWIKFDDDKVSIVTPEDILRLSGGGDWHIAYVLLYGPRRVEIMEEESEQ
jgi:ubiquitin carboxyl-terminal hydrolase 14